MVCLWQLIILFPPAKYGFNNSESLNAFASKAATNAVMVGTLRQQKAVMVGSNGRRGLTSGLA